MLLTKKFLKSSDFESAFGERFTPFLVDRINRYPFEYEDFTQPEQERLLITIIDALLNQNLVQSGEHRINDWERGWSENSDALSEGANAANSIIPKYFNKHNAIRWQGKFIRPVSDHFELHSLYVILDWLFDTYCRSASEIYEFGCGTGHNLLRIRDFNPDARLWGLDWARSSQQILQKINESGVDNKVFGHRFDYFHPDQNFSLAPDSVIYTVASLEQIGNRWGPFVDYILRQRPRLCIHVEPIAELLNQDTLLDNLSCKYFQKRNYLDGFLTGLRDLEEKGMLKIHRAQRTGIGSLFIEGYSVIVWSPA